LDWPLLRVAAGTIGPTPPISLFIPTCIPHLLTTHNHGTLTHIHTYTHQRCTLHKSWTALAFSFSKNRTHQIHLELTLDLLLWTFQLGAHYYPASTVNWYGRQIHWYQTSRFASP